MCIIAAIPTKKEISKATLQRCWNNNPHGGGFMFTDGKHIQVFKEMSSFKRYWKSFVHAREQYPESSFICHFRISTHGKINETNCHPFHVNNKLGFCHNGIIRNAPYSQEYSDTYMFNATILQNLPTNFLGNLAIQSLIKDYIGGGSKLAFLSHDNKITLINESAGQWDANGVWFSNGGYKEHDYFDAGGTRVNGSSGWYGGGSYSKSYGKVGQSYQQSSMGFASAAFPSVNEKKKKVENIDWDKRLKADKIDKEVVAIAHNSCCDTFDYSKRYEEQCGFCDKVLNTYTEKQNGYCHKCEDKYSKEWSL